MHIVFLIADNASVPYFKWFAEESSKHKNLKFSFVSLNTTPTQMRDDMKPLNVDYYWIPYNPNDKKKSALKAIPKLYILFRNIRPDIVHSHLFDDSVPALIAARLAGIKIRVITKQDTTFHWNYAPHGIKFDRLNNYNATHIIAVSEECKQFIIEKEKANPSKIILIHHGIPIQKATNQSEVKKQELIKKYNLEGNVIIGTVARLIEWKGYKKIIDAIEIVSKKKTDVRFLFVGEGEQKQELQKLIEEKKLNNYIIFTQWIERDYIPSLYGIMDIYLHAATFEPFGFVIAEAMANGVPVVSAKTGAAMDAIEHLKNGYLVLDNSKENIAKGIFYMLENARKEIGKAGKTKAIQMYSFEQMWHNHIKLYSNAMGVNIQT
jgi:glycosyltransferase involved in cell wall biosynthesis